MTRAQIVRYRPVSATEELEHEIIRAVLFNLVIISVGADDVLGHS